MFSCNSVTQKDKGYTAKSSSTLTPYSAPYIPTPSAHLNILRDDEESKKSITELRARLAVMEKRYEENSQVNQIIAHEYRRTESAGESVVMDKLQNILLDIESLNSTPFCREKEEIGVKDDPRWRNRSGVHAREIGLPQPGVNQIKPLNH